MDVPVKNKKRAKRIKRNFIAKALREDTKFKTKVVGLVKHKRPKKVSVKDVERFLVDEEL